MNTPTWTLQDRIRKAREHAGLKQEELAALLSVTRHTLGRWEKGDNEPPTKKIEALAEVTGVPVEWFYADSANEESPVRLPSRLVLELQDGNYLVRYK